MRNLACALLAVLLSAFSLLSASSASASTDQLSTLVSGVPWHTSSSSSLAAESSFSPAVRVQAHTSSVIQANGRYYLFGKVETQDKTFKGIACYASDTLSDWSYEGLALAPSSSIPDLNPAGIVQRARVLYNASTKEYVMWMHIDDDKYNEARVGVAVSKSPCGPYRYLGSSRPLGHPSRDIGVFQDDDGTAYLLSEDRSIHSLRVDKMSSDYLSVVASPGLGGSVTTLKDWHKSIEAPAMVKVDGVYYLFGSHLTGFRLNDNIVQSATSLDGFWSAPELFAPFGSHTYKSQTDGILAIHGTQKTTYIYMGDRWDAHDLRKSTEIWYPITFDRGIPRLQKEKKWTIDLKTGQWHPGL